ncbi:core-2 i-branching beta- -n-acetylglucosaminyltransferase family protein isoform 1 [Hordeum vulgare]|nr:core-2 i-branching beta- -n-acetylglucosaminyltransferase family protein isoform 1 [Hordeum vulgare]
MAKPWGILLLVSMAFALGIASNFLLRFLPATATMIQLIAADLSVPALVLRPPSLRLLGDDNANESWRMVMLHNMTDDELLLAASMDPRISSLVQGAPKVAFMFLVRGELPLAPLWERFFHGHTGLFSVYVHPDPSYLGSPEKGSVFYSRRVPSKEARWEQSSIVEAERRLLANALLDTTNEHFVLLSETCIPLYNFTTVYSYLTHSTGATSFIDLFDNASSRGRYKRAMAPAITPAQWRKGSQWFAVDRSLALGVIDDVTYFPVFQRHCSAPCIMDEHYLPTFVAASRCNGNANRTLTYTRWTRGPHPDSYNEVSVGLLEGMRINKNCTDGGGNTSVCYLFARKFPSRALPELLRLAPRVMRFG